MKHATERKTEGRIEVTGRRGKRRKELLDELKGDIRYWKQRGSTRSHSLENSFWKRLWTCRKTDYGLNE